MKHSILYGFLLTGMTIAICSCSSSSSGNGQLVFQTGFEGTSRIVPFDESKTNAITPDFVNQTFTGKDHTLTEKSDWDKDITENPDAGLFIIEYTGGDESKRYARIIPEPGNEKNHVLHFWLNDYWLASENQEKARVQVSLYEIPQGYKEFYQSVRVFLPEDWNALRTFPERIPWLTIAEFWNNEWWVKGEKYGFRITLGIGKPGGEESDLNFILAADDSGKRDVWVGDNTELKVPVGKWFTMDYYLKEGDRNTGRFYMTITPENEPTQIVFDITDYTHNTKDPAPDGFTGYNPMKLYTSKEIVSFLKSQGKTLQIYWDDLRVWKDKSPDSN